jgi:hypothetical protein
MTLHPPAIRRKPRLRGGLISNEAVINNDGLCQEQLTVLFLCKTTTIGSQWRAGAAADANRGWDVEVGCEMRSGNRALLHARVSTASRPRSLRRPGRNILISRLLNPDYNRDIQTTLTPSLSGRRCLCRDTGDGPRHDRHGYDRDGRHYPRIEAKRRINRTQQIAHTPQPAMRRVDYERWKAVLRSAIDALRVGGSL